MFTYLLIGLGVQAITIAEILIRKIASFKDWTLVTTVLFVVAIGINILIWPISIASEIYNIIHEQ